MALKGLLGKKQDTVAGGLEPSPQIDLDPVATDYAADPMAQAMPNPASAPVGQGYPGQMAGQAQAFAQGQVPGQGIAPQAMGPAAQGYTAAQGVPAQGIPAQPFVTQAAPAQAADPAVQVAQSQAQSAIAAQAATEAAEGTGKKARKARGKKNKKGKDDPDARPDLSKLKKKELLEILVAQGEEIDALRERVVQLEAQLANRQFDMQRVGSLAEASVQVSDIFKDAEEAARIYLENIRRRYV